jgi:putative Mn2+ efflux pump MntP
MSKLLTLILLGFSVGLGNFAASVAIGLSGVTKSLRIRIAIIFGLFETGMPIIGLIVGKQVANKLGGHSNIIGGALLLATGFYIIISSLRKSDKKETTKTPNHGLGKLIVTGLALSVDNLIVGFSLGTHHEPLFASAIVIGITSVVLSIIGLEIGSRLSSKVEKYSELLSGLILVLVGIAIGLKFL